MGPSLRPVVASCALMAASDAARADGTVRIGWLSSLTGPLSSSAIAENQGVRYADYGYLVETSHIVGQGTPVALHDGALLKQVYFG